jgi:hypothetical protein
MYNNNMVLSVILTVHIKSGEVIFILMWQNYSPSVTDPPMLLAKCVQLI